jgi:hypothetical protein
VSARLKRPIRVLDGCQTGPTFPVGLGRFIVALPITKGETTTLAALKRYPTVHAYHADVEWAISFSINSSRFQPPRHHAMHAM